MSQFETYYNFMAEYVGFFKEVVELESKKLEALLSNDLEKIIPTMSEYQACIKKVQQYEQKRIDLCNELGFGNMAFSAIAKCFSGAEKKKLIVQKAELESLINSIRYMNKKSMEFASIQLQYSDEMATATSKSSHMYNSKGTADSVLDNAQLLDTKV